MSKMLDSVLASPRSVAALLLLGAAERIAWLSTRSEPSYAIGEAPDIAISLARTGAYANAFSPDSGPSAHVLPISPLIAGGVYYLLGVRTPAAETLLAGWSIGLTLLSFLLLYLIFRELGASRFSRVAALAIACLLPLNVHLETSYFRVWEGALATSTGLAYLLMLIRLDRAPAIDWRAIVGIALAAGLVFFIAPQLGVACYAGAAFLTARRLPPKRWPGAIVAATAGLALFLVPWAIRNEQAMGAPIWLRSNFGLELTLGMNPAAVHTHDPERTFRDRMAEIHPTASDAALARLKAAGGEQAYAEALGKRTKAWIAAHPADAATLALRHLGEMLFPPAWYWSERGSGTIVKLAVAWICAALALLWIASIAPRRQPTMVYPALMVLLPILPYMITQPILRYRYVIFGLTLFMACDLAARLPVRSAISRRRAPGMTDRQAA